MRPQSTSTYDIMRDPSEEGARSASQPPADEGARTAPQPPADEPTWSPLSSKSSAELREEIEGLRRALETHPVIDTARGILMASAPCSRGQAWHVLVEVSQHTGVALHTVAQRLVDGVQGPAPSRPIRDALDQALSRVRQTAGTPE
ncbi:ANTAR domain-containing protein (plasmid) [Streptomyces sp. CA-294286]|uniref:ANTAR domain-containing protein n=1 Tax=Streptomyces sp. CA-294286 TaxID=3240070 RepID=UPI003D8EE4AE